MRSCAAIVACAPASDAKSRSASQPRRATSAQPQATATISGAKNANCTCPDGRPTSGAVESASNNVAASGILETIR